MGTRLIFLGLLEVTNAVSRIRLSDCGCGEGVPGNNSSL